MQWSLILLILMGQWSSCTCQLYEYHFVSENKTWTEAQSYCRDRYIDLAVVNNMEDVKRLSKHNNAGEAWIGLRHSKSHNKTWHWSLPSVECNQEERKWRNGQPNDKNSAENCVMMRNDLMWGDFPCCEKGFFICSDGETSPTTFHLIKEEKTWLLALKYCRANHTDLVSGRTQLDKAAAQLSKEIKQLEPNVNIVIGLYRDFWAWSGGSNSSFRNWRKDFDNHFENGSCAVTGGKGEWRSKQCTSMFPFFCYKDNLILIKENKTWEEAIDYCREKHVDLVCIPDRFTQHLVQDKAKNATSEYVWLGLRYSCIVDFWFWVSDEATGYHNWANETKREDCDMSGAMEIQGPNYGWVSLGDERRLNFICVKKTSDDRHGRGP